VTNKFGAYVARFLRSFHVAMSDTLKQ